MEIEKQMCDKAFTYLYRINGRVGWVKKFYLFDSLWGQDVTQTLD